MDFWIVQAPRVAEELVLSEMLAVVGGHDDNRVAEYAAALEFHEELPELFIEVGDAVVVGVDRQLHFVGVELPLVQRPPTADDRLLRTRPSRPPNRYS